MQHFPVSSSIVDALYLGKFLSSAYSFKGTVTCSLVRAGINHTYLVKTGEGQFVFRIYSLNWRTRREILAEIGLINDLKQGDLPVSNPLTDTKGDYIQEIPAAEGLRLGVLFSYAYGKKIHSYPAEVHREAGRLMARFHQLTKNKEIERVYYNTDRLLTEPIHFIRQFLSAESEEMSYLLQLQQRLTLQFGAESGSFRKGVVHLDIWFENFSITAENKIILFDFDFCGNGWLGLDLAFYVAQVQNLARYDAAVFQPNLDAFFDGYESILPIPQDERNMLGEFGITLLIFYLGVQCQRFENWSNTFLSEDYLKRFINGIIRRLDHPNLQY